MPCVDGSELARAFFTLCSIGRCSHVFGRWRQGEAELDSIAARSEAWRPSEFGRCKSLAEFEARRLLYILGVRERTDKLVRELVLDDPAPFVPLVPS